MRAAPVSVPSAIWPGGFRLCCRAVGSCGIKAVGVLTAGTSLLEGTMGIFSASELSARDEGKVLGAAFSLVSEHAKPGAVEIRKVLSVALKGCGFVRDTNENGRRVWRLMRVVAKVQRNNNDTTGVAAWAATASGAEIKALLIKAQQDRQ